MVSPPWIVPAWSATLTGVTDVQAIMDAMDTTVKAAAVGWTEPVADTFKTPIDPAGRWLQLALVRATALRLQCTMTDDQGRATDQREMQIASGNTVELYYGTRYLYIVNRNQNDFLWANMLTLYPEAENAHLNYCLFHGGRNNAGTAGNANTSTARSINASNVYAELLSHLDARFAGITGTADAPMMQHISGARRWLAGKARGLDAGPQTNIRGRLYNVLLGHGTNAYNTDRSIPINESEFATFRVMNIAQGTGAYVLAIRKG